MPALALLFELADRRDVAASPYEVTLEHAQQAAAWCDYLATHARRVYAGVVTPQLRAARELANKITRGHIGAEGSFSARDVYLKGWSSLDTPEAVRLATTSSRMRIGFGR